jgi:hypothetical protein
MRLTRTDSAAAAAIVFELLLPSCEILAHGCGRLESSRDPVMALRRKGILTFLFTRCNYIGPLSMGSSDLAYEIYYTLFSISVSLASSVFVMRLVCLPHNNYDGVDALVSCPAAISVCGLPHGLVRLDVLAG